MPFASVLQIGVRVMYTPLPGITSAAVRQIQKSARLLEPTPRPRYLAFQAVFMHQKTRRQRYIPARINSRIPLLLTTRPGRRCRHDLGCESQARGRVPPAPAHCPRVVSEAAIVADQNRARTIASTSRRFHEFLRRQHRPPRA